MSGSGATMLALVYHGPEDLRVERRAAPEIGPGEVLVKVEAASICATDLRIVAGAHRKFAPGVVRIPGHEVAGVVAGIGRDVRGLEVGQRVFVAPNFGCGKCLPCAGGRNNLCPGTEALGITLDGAFAEYVRIPAAAVEQDNVIPLAAHVSTEVAALAEPLACVLHGQKAIAIGAGDKVVILGAGPIGMIHLLLAKSRGARKVIVSDPVRERLELARAFGADRTVNPESEDLERAVRDETSDEGASAVIVATPAAQAFEQALEIAGVGGRINLFAGLPRDRSVVPLNCNLIHYKELLVTGTTACSTSDCRNAIELVAAGLIDLSPLVSGRYPLTASREAFDTARDRRGLKVLFEPGIGG